MIRLGALLRAIWFTPSNLLVRREALQTSGGCDERVFVQDYTLALRLARLCRFGVSDTSIVAAPDPVEVTADRVSANKVQILHDLNLALLLFIEESPELPAQLPKTCLAADRRPQLEMGPARSRPAIMVTRAGAPPRRPTSLGSARQMSAVPRDLCSRRPSTPTNRLPLTAASVM